MKNYFTKSQIVPTQDDLYLCTEIMETVDELAPSDANVNAVINQLSDGTYHTHIAIQSSSGKFYSEAQTFSLLSSLKQAQGIILSSLENWKCTRFAN